MGGKKPITTQFLTFPSKTTFSKLASLFLLASLFSKSLVNSEYITPYEAVPIREPGRCSINGDCGVNPDRPAAGKNHVPCLSNAPAFTPDRSLFTDLRETCPDLVRNATDFSEVKVCCDQSQIEAIRRSLNQAAPIFQRCPSCYYNFRQIYCQTVCHPDQSVFLTPTQVYTPTEKEHENELAVSSYTVAISEKTPFQWYNSCDEVFYNQLNDIGINVMCQPPPEEPECTPFYWLDYQGKNKLSPIVIEYSLIGEPGDNVTAAASCTYEEFRGLVPVSERCAKGAKLLDDDRVVPKDMIYQDENTNYEFSSVWESISGYCAEPEPWSDSEQVCSCTDCHEQAEGVCLTDLPQPESTDYWYHWYWSIGLLVVCLVSFFVTVYFVPENIPDIELSSVARGPIHRNAGLSISDPTGLETVYVRMSKVVGNAFQWWAEEVVCKFPKITLLIVFVFVAVCCAGFPQTEFTTDPVELWVDPNSQVYKELDYYNSKFDPFYRSEVVIATLKPELRGPGYNVKLCNGQTQHFSEILQTKYMTSFFEIQNGIFNTLPDTKEVCFKPLEPDNDFCATQSIFQWWQNDLDNFLASYNTSDLQNCRIYENAPETISWHDHFSVCSINPSSIDDGASQQTCLGEYGGPGLPFVALGGADSSESGKFDYTSATALIMTLENNNVDDKSSTEYEKALLWEEGFINFMKKAAEESEYFDIAFFSERSIEDEIDRAGQADVPLFIGAYVTIFIYLSIALGSYTAINRILFEVRFTLGLVGLFIVASSAFASLGIFGYAHVKSNLIVAEVVPFLLLAIGADNIFIFVLEYKRVELELKRKGEFDTPIEKLIGTVLNRSAMSMVLCSTAECVLLFYGALTVDMPAVKTYALNAGVAILLNFVLQMTAFLAVLTLDLKRIKAKRADIICCLVDDSVKKVGSEDLGEIMDRNPTDSTHSKKTAENDDLKDLWIDTFFEKYWFEWITNKYSRLVIIASFVTVTCVSLGIVFEKTRVGLDQDLGVPDDSYVKTFFEFEEAYLLVGAPVYFVIAGQIDYNKKEIQNAICSTLGCDNDSMGQMIFIASQNTSYWKIETPSQSWIDDYIDWGSAGSLTARKGPCCNCKGTCNNFDQFCPANNQEESPFPHRDCRKCIGTRVENRFYDYVSWFLRDNPGDQCAKSGHAAYAHAVHYINQTGLINDSIDFDQGIDATSFMTYESVCIYSEECTENVQKARILADQITDMLRSKLGVKSQNETGLLDDDVYVFPYTLYTPYYEMYLTMGQEGLVLIALCFIPIFIVSTVFLGFNFLAGTICTITNIMITINTAAICALWNVQFNPLSIINYITGIGISVEFTAHMTSAYLSDKSPTRFERVRSALKTMGPAVTMGVTMTNLPGMIVLKFATAKIIEVYFFRMGFTLTLVGFVHGIVFLPVLLTYIGPRRNPALGKSSKKEKTEEKTKEVSGVSNEAATTE